MRLLALVAVLFACATAAVALAAVPGGHAERDSDRDGLGDSFERTRSHTRVHRRDSDRDGLRDGVEVKRFHTDPLRRDTDRDRLQDRAEIRVYRTNPRRRDTDGDGLSDWVEIRRSFTNPRKPDSDDDRLADGEEIRQFQTSPGVADTDIDGIGDGDEVHPLPSARPGSRSGTAPRPRPTDPTDPTDPEPPPAPPPSTRPVRSCSRTVASLPALQAAVQDANGGAVVCLANGSYGRLELDASKSAEVVAQPASSGGATIAGATLAGSHLTLEGFVVSGAEVTVQPGSDHMRIQYNRVSGGYFGVNAGPTTDVTVDDVTIKGNKFVGPFGEDAIRLNRYHDGDGDGAGALIEGNEFTNVRENGAHSDCLQAVWVGDHLVFRRNYLHDNRCQGFFVKDQASAVDSILAEENLFVRNAEPCAGTDSACGLPAPFQVWGPVAAFRGSHNTVWEGLFTLREGPWTSTIVTDSVLHKVYADSSEPFANYTAARNVACDTASRLEYPLTGITTNCSPPFADPAHDDYRLPSGQGVRWRPGDQQYGP